MSTVVLDKPKAMRLTLIEYMAPFSDRVDRENRVIRGVKIIGMESGNSVRIVGIDSDETYEYTPEALKAAIPLYEGVVVNLDHPDFQIDSSGERHAISATKTAQRFGRLVNVKFIEGKGLIGNLEYLATHPLAEMVVEAAERMPETLALSHNARGNVTKQNGKFVVDEIGDVRSVDLIAEKPGTTHSLFEQLTDEENDMALHAPTEKEKTQLEALHGNEEEEKLVSEQEEEEEEEVVEQEEAALDPAAMVEEGFRAAINALLDDDSLSDDALKAKLEELVTKRAETKAVLTGGESGDVSEQEEDEEKEKVVAEQEEEKKDDAAGAIAESLALDVVVKKYRKVKRENDTLRRESDARDLLESKGVKASKVRVKALAGLDDKKLQVELIESFSPAAARHRRPLVTRRDVSTSNSVSEFPKDAKSFAAACR